MPDIPNIGQSSYSAPQVNRPVARYNTPEIPVSPLGAIAGTLEKQVATQTALDLANAKSNWLRSNIDAENAFNNDQDFTTMPQRYQKLATDNLNQSLSLVNDPRERQLLQYQLQADMAQSNQKIIDLADVKRKDHNHAVILDSGQKNIDAALRTNDTNIRDQLMQQNISMIDNSDLSETAKAELKKGQVEQYGTTWLRLHPPSTQIDLLSGKKTVPISDVIKGDDADHLTRMAMLESSGDHTAINPNTGASGLFQFQGETARQYGLKDPTDTQSSIDAARKLNNDNKTQMTNLLGREPTNPELYLALQQGATGASAIISNPNQSAVQALISVGVSPTKAQNSIELNGGNLSTSSAEFAKHWEDKYNNVDISNHNDVTIYPKTGTPADFIPVAKKIELHDAAIADQAALIRAQNQMKEQQDKQIQGDFLNKFYAGSLKTDDVMNSQLPAVGTGSKKDFMDMIKDGPKVGNPALHNQLYQSVLQGIVSDPSQLVPYMAQKDGISVEQAQNLASAMNKGPDESQKAFLIGAKPQITGSNDLLGIKDPQGDAKYSAMLFELDRMIQEGKKKGLSSRDLLDPSSKNYVGKQLISTYVSTDQEKIDATVNAFSGGNSNAPSSNNISVSPSQPAPAIPFGAIQYLRQNPNTAADFEKHFGVPAKDYLK